MVRTPAAEIEAVVKTENIGQVRVNVSADAEDIFGADEPEQAAEDYLLREFEEVVSVIEVI